VYILSFIFLYHSLNTSVVRMTCGQWRKVLSCHPGVCENNELLIFTQIKSGVFQSDVIFIILDLCDICYKCF